MRIILRKTNKELRIILRKMNKNENYFEKNE